MADAREFLDAIREGDRERVRAMLGDEPGLASATAPSGISPVLMAVYYGRNEIAEQVAASKPELDFLEAVVLGRMERVEQFLKEDPALANHYSPDGYPPLGLAAFFGQPQVLRCLIEHGADPNAASTNSMRVAPLHGAVAHTDLALAEQMARVLLEHGAEVNTVQMGGWMPLHEAARRNMIETARLLLRHGADPRAMNDDGTTPLELAEQEGHHQMVELLKAA